MGRDRKVEGRKEHFAKMNRSTMETAAWKALSPTAQALYPWLRLEWHGPKINNNGKLQLSVRQAANRLGVSLNTAARAFHDLQAKGFIVITEAARLGLSGDAKASKFELTEIALPNSNKSDGRRCFMKWKNGHDFPVHKSAPNNPKGVNGRTADIALIRSVK